MKLLRNKEYEFNLFKVIIQIFEFPHISPISFNQSEQKYNTFDLQKCNFLESYVNNIKFQRNFLF